MRLVLLTTALVLALGCTSQKDDSSVATSGSDSDVFHNLNLGNKSFGLQGTRALVLTIDDGPSESTMSMLKLLKAHKIKADFFINGKNVPKYGASLPSIVKAGHNLSNHSEHHYSLRSLTAEQIFAEILATDQVIRQYVPKNQPLYFRAPGGGWNYNDSASPEVLKAVSYLNQDPRLKHYIGPIFWSIGGELKFDAYGSILASADWDCWAHKLDTTTCAQGYLNEISKNLGGVILVHDSPQTVEMLSILIPVLKKAGYQFVMLEQLRGLQKE